MADLPSAIVQHGAAAKARTELDVHSLRDLWINQPISHCFLERVSARPGQGTVSMFRFGEASGQTYGLIVGLKLSVSYIRPLEWQRFHQIGPSPDAARLRCMQLWPDSAKQFSRKRDQHRADAALIAAYGRHLLQQLPDATAAPDACRHPAAWPSRDATGAVRRDIGGRGRG